MLGEKEEEEHDAREGQREDEDVAPVACGGG